MNRSEQMELDTQNSLNLSLRDVYIFLRHPATVITSPRPSCLANKRVRVTLALRAMLPYDHVIVEGVEVRRTPSGREIAFVVNGKRYYDFEKAVDAVTEAGK